jgi:hypothetical protein
MKFLGDWLTNNDPKTMQIYINKSRQQHQPFDENIFRKILQSGQLLSTAFGIKKGQRDWQRNRKISD